MMLERERGLSCVSEKERKLNPIQDGPLQGCSRKGRRVKDPPRPYLKSVTYNPKWLNLIQLLLTYRRFKKYINDVTHNLISAGISIFLQILPVFGTSRIKDKNCILTHDLWFFDFHWAFKGYFNQHDFNFDDFSKFGLLKIKTF